MNQRYIKADWPAPENVVAFSSTRAGGCSVGAYKGLNLGHHVGDDLALVDANRELLSNVLPDGARVQWLSQTHGAQVVRAGDANGYPQGDACVSTQVDEVCAILSADCLPVLLCNRRGTIVAAAHAGWRGLLSGVLEATVDAMNCDGEELLAWMGPAIGPAAFEVGPEVRSGFIEAVGASSLTELSLCFTRSPTDSQRYMADLCALASLRLRKTGVRHIYGGTQCTYSDADNFFSYRRDGQTGRMATLICIKSI
ncbi:MAG: YfiH family protein [Halioglobus sp.]